MKYFKEGVEVVEEFKFSSDGDVQEEEEDDILDPDNEDGYPPKS